MPARQATPGSSTAVVLQPQEVNGRKRPLSQSEQDIAASRNRKKLRKEPTTDASLNPTKDRKKRRKRRRKVSVVQSEGRSRSRSQTREISEGAPQSPRMAPIHSQSTNAGPSNVDEPGVVVGITTPPVDKGKEKALATDDHIPDTAAESAETEVEQLSRELEAQTTLLHKYQAHLSNIQQSLTCQICLELLHKPFTVSPCGHIACHSCLIQWFTAPREGNQRPTGADASYYRKKKTCPVCRTLVTERPVEVWSIKDMVASLVKSGLADVSDQSTASSDPTVGLEGNPDPWFKIYRRASRRRYLGSHNVAPGSLEDMGMLDAEDGRIYRCIDCMHEIWDGVCTNCERIYMGHYHQRREEEEDDFSDRDAPMHLGRVGVLRGFMDMLSRRIDPDDVYMSGGDFDEEDDEVTEDEDEGLMSYDGHGLGSSEDDGDSLDGYGHDEDVDDGNTDEEEYEDSFIDDEEVNGSIQDEDVAQDYVDDEEDSLTDDSEDHDFYSLEDDGMDESRCSTPTEVDEYDPRWDRRYSSRRAPILIVSDDDDGSDDDRSLPATRRSRLIVISDDEHDQRQRRLSR